MLITPVSPFCESDATYILQGADAGGTWSATCGTCIDQNTGEFNPTLATIGINTITYSLGGNCGDTQTLDVTVTPDMDATITSIGTLCIGNAPVNLVATDAGGTWAGIGIIDPVNGTFDPTTAGAGTHLITYEITGICGDVGTTLVTVNDPLSVIALSNQTICEGQSVSISALDQGGDGNYTYTWDDGNGNILNGQFQIVSPMVTTTYTVTLSDECGTTTVSDDATITINPIPTIDLSVDIIAGCSPVTVALTNNSTPTSDNFLWEFGDTYTSSNCGPISHTYTEPGCYDVTLTASSGGCSNSLTQTNLVCVYENAIADFTPINTEAELMNPVFEFENNSQNADSYFWTFGDENTSTNSDY